jgi:hypothetical protein
VKRKLLILDLEKYHEQLKRFAQIVMENEKFVNKCRQHLGLCKLLVHVMYVNEYEKYTKKAEKLWRMVDWKK